MKLSKLEEKGYEWLKDSDVYNSLDPEDTDEIDFIYCSDQEENIYLFLNVINLWGVNFCPLEFFDLFIKERAKLINKEIIKLTGIVE